VPRNGRPPARQAILSATRTLLERNPPGEVSMDAVAVEAGFSRQAIYRHFGSRAGLLTELLESIDVAEGAPRAVQQVLAAKTGPASIDALFEWWVDYVPRFVGIARGVLAAKHADGDLRLAWEDRMQALLSVCRAVAERCRADDGAEGAPSIEESAQTLWALLSIPLWIQLREDAGWSAEQCRRRLSAVAVAALCGTDRSNDG
jgi:AcrR family transcriptional regulator